MKNFLSLKKEKNMKTYVLSGMHPQHRLAPNQFPVVPPDAELGGFLLDFYQIWVDFYQN